MDTINPAFISRRTYNKQPDTKNNHPHTHIRNSLEARNQEGEGAETTSQNIRTSKLDTHTCLASVHSYLGSDGLNRDHPLRGLLPMRRLPGSFKSNKRSPARPNKVERSGGLSQSTPALSTYTHRGSIKLDRYTGSCVHT